MLFPASMERRHRKAMKARKARRIPERGALRREGTSGSRSRYLHRRLPAGTSPKYLFPPGDGLLPPTRPDRRPESRPHPPPKSPTHHHLETRPDQTPAQEPPPWLRFCFYRCRALSWQQSGERQVHPATGGLVESDAMCISCASAASSLPSEGKKKHWPTPRPDSTGPTACAHSF